MKPTAERMADLAYDDEHLKRLVVLWAKNTLVHQLAARLLAVREARSIGFIQDQTSGHDSYVLKAFYGANLNIGDKVYAAPPAPAVPADYQHLKHVSESYFAVEKRLFDLAQRLKGPSFDHYAYSLHQAIDVLDKEIFGENEDSSATLAAAPTPTKAADDA